MADKKDLKPGTKITFKPGGRGSNAPISGEVVRHDGAFVVTKGANGLERKIRPGSISLA